MSCNFCKKRNHVLIKCKYCEFSYCVKHVVLEIHNCTNLNKLKNDLFEENEKLLTKNATKSIKIDEI